MMMLQEDSAPENQVDNIQQRLDEGATWKDLTKEERKVIICASRKAGLPWRKIAERVGKKTTQTSTITSWVRDHLPDLLTGMLQAQDADPTLFFRCRQCGHTWRDAR